VAAAYLGARLLVTPDLARPSSPASAGRCSTSALPQADDPAVETRTGLRGGVVLVLALLVVVVTFLRYARMGTGATCSSA